MKKTVILFLSLITLFFTGCFSIPGYVSSDGSITPPYSKKVIINSVSGSISVIILESSKGITNINPEKSDPFRTGMKNTYFIAETKSYYCTLEGNHSITFAIRTMDEEAVFKIKYKGKEKEFTIHNTDTSDKLIFLENYTKVK